MSAHVFKCLSAALVLCTWSGFVHAQTADSNAIKRVYDRCLDMDETKADSIAFYANYIAEASAKINYDRGEVLSSRLKGLSEDLKGNYPTAIGFYLQSLNASRKLKSLIYELAALNDLAYIYVNIKQPALAKEMYLQCVQLAEMKNDVYSLESAYGNVGAIYNQLNMPDSALYFLQKGLKVAEPIASQLDMSSLYNNVGNVYFQKKDYDRALVYFRKNLLSHDTASDPGAAWLDYLNIADVFLEQRLFDSAALFAGTALRIALRMESRSKESDTYSLLSRLYERRGDYQRAFDYQKKWYSIDTSLVNQSTNETVANLQERFNAAQRNQENRLLHAEVTQANLRSRTFIWLSIAAGIIILLIAVSLLQKRLANERLRKTNALISRQNDKLAELNFEKNSLISIVSHDLGAPFSSIKMWSQILDADASGLNAEQQKAVARIRESTARGEKMIRTILDVEKAETNQQRLKLEQFELKVFVEALVDDFRPAARGKEIHLHVETPEKEVYLVSDKQLVSRICENLVSNALKFTPKQKNVWVSLSELHDAVRIQVRDEGIGIATEEQAHLFSKYSKISSRPTNGEGSTGLGLSIVKRLVEELNGSIDCKSEDGSGSLFTVVLKK